MNAYAYITDVTGKLLQVVLRKLLKNNDHVVWRFVKEDGDFTVKECSTLELKHLITFAPYGFADVPMMEGCKTLLDAVVGGSIFNLARYEKDKLPMLNYHNCMVESL